MSALTLLRARAKALCLELHGFGDPADCPACQDLMQRRPWWKPGGHSRSSWRTRRNA